jgi:hypothetical protein
LQTREVHIGVGLRVIYDILKPSGLGRDVFISIGLAYGFMLITFKIQLEPHFQAHIVVTRIYW